MLPPKGMCDVSHDVLDFGKQVIPVIDNISLLQETIIKDHDSTKWHKRLKNLKRDFILFIICRYFDGDKEMFTPASVVSFKLT